jgi:hypothetical protein
MFNEQFLNDNFWLVIAIFIFDYVLKAIALWISARKGSKVWFVMLLLLNTLGILPLFYIFYFSKQEPNQKTDKL